ncbi:hypothetical protein QBC47DRAFT_461373 [Echria macrotheca]|uniref:Uncharacterized protein n=1 Tax=Echria macrotheca TaxID=438768 RepID=A0AAJ0BDK7_9PEZI|nr:hypothetical protein QBC47DRAFT_461373 [Echria macrotheca]
MTVCPNRMTVSNRFWRKPINHQAFKHSIPKFRLINNYSSTQDPDFTSLRKQVVKVKGMTSDRLHVQLVGWKQQVAKHCVRVQILVILIILILILIIEFRWICSSGEAASTPKYPR